MINTVLGWGTAAPHWSEVMKLLFWISLVVFFLVAPLLSTDRSGRFVSAVGIGDAQREGNVLSDLAPRSDAALELGRRRASSTISPLVTDSVHLPITVAGVAVVMCLSHEREVEGLTFRLRIPEGIHIRIRLTYRVEE